MNNFKYLAIWMLTLALAACGGGGGDSLTGGSGGGGGGNPTATTLTLIKSSDQLESASNVPVEISAIVTDVNNGAVADALVTFSASTTGALLSSSTVLTDANGLAKVNLSTQTNPTNRVITVTAALSGGGSSSVTVNVVGTTVAITGPDALGVGESAVYTVAVANSENQPLSGRNVTLSSANSNTISAPNLVTGPGGTIQFTLTADNTTNDIVTATSMGASGDKVVAVSSDSFTIVSPSAGQEIPINSVVNITVRWIQGGSPKVGSIVNFASARGTLSAFSQVTNGAGEDGAGAGEATVTLSSTSSGVSELTVSDPLTGAGNSIAVEFVATDAATLTLTPQLVNLVPGQTTTLAARVEDSNGNAVKNKTIVFSLPADDTNGNLSPLLALTDSSGNARSFYTAGPISSGNGAVTVSAVVSGTPAATDSVDLTVGGQSFSFDIGTGNSIEELNDDTYGKTWTIIVTDANSNPVASTTVQVAGPPTRYRKGFWFVNGADEWEQSIQATCDAEDANRNGQLDPGEDFNTNGTLEPRNIVSVVPFPSSAPLNATCENAATTGGATSVVTNSFGLARVCLVYTQDKAYWAEIELTATAGVSGSESSASEMFWLTGAASDFEDPQTAVPGEFSPYGIEADCSLPD